MKSKTLFWFAAIAAIFLAFTVNVAIGAEDSDEPDLCCYMFDEELSECRCNVGWKCNKDKVVNDMCMNTNCFSNCKITNWALGAIIAAAAVLLFIFIVVIVICCKKKEDDYEVDY